jgi:hypothetical protein
MIFIGIYNKLFTRRSSRWPNRILLAVDSGAVDEVDGVDGCGAGVDGSGAGAEEAGVLGAAEAFSDGGGVAVVDDVDGVTGVGSERGANNTL